MWVLIYWVSCLGKFQLVKWRSLGVGYKLNALLMNTVATLGEFATRITW